MWHDNNFSKQRLNVLCNRFLPCGTIAAGIFSLVGSSMASVMKKYGRCVSTRAVRGLRLFVGVCFLWLLVSCGSGQGERQTPLPENPEGKLVFINYWAEWCTPCREEIPELNQFLKTHADKAAVYGVNFDGLSGDALADVEARLGVKFPTLATDPGAYLGLPPPGILPVTLVVNDEEQVVAELVGEQTVQSLEDTLLRLLAAEEEQ